MPRKKGFKYKRLKNFQSPDDEITVEEVEVQEANSNTATDYETENQASNDTTGTEVMETENQESGDTTKAHDDHMEDMLESYFKDQQQKMAKKRKNRLADDTNYSPNEKQRRLYSKVQSNSKLKQKESIYQKEKKQNQRLKPGVKEKERDTMRGKMRELRQDPKVKEKERDKKRYLRQNPNIKEKEQEKKRQKRRQNPDVKEKEREQKKKARAPPSSKEKAIKAFNKHKYEGPTYICNCCNRLLYKTSVGPYDLQTFKEEDQEFVKEICSVGVQTSYLCGSCKNSLVKKEMPDIAVANGLEVEEVPEPLQRLNEIGAMLIARRHPFMKIVGLPRGRQRAIFGACVNVPFEPEEVLSALPNVNSTNQVVMGKLKRKLSYKGHVYTQEINVHDIKAAFHCLKYEVKNKLYEDIEFNEQWHEEALQANEELRSCLLYPDDGDGDDDNANNGVLEKETDGDEQVGDHADDAANEKDTEDHLGAPPLDSCLQPKDVSASSYILNLAPGEGKKPLHMEMDKNSEEKSFPTLLPSGQFGFDFDRPKKVSMKKYFKHRVTHCDPRFANDNSYLFYAQYRCEAKEVSDGLSISLRKGKNAKLTASDVKTRMEDLVRTDLSISFLQKVRGSPAFFQKMFYDLLGMIRYLGPCTFFVTLSAADLKWPDLYSVLSAQRGTRFTSEEIARLTYIEKCDMMRLNPVTVARHFDHRLDGIMKHIILNKNLQPLGRVITFKLRIEFQQR